MRFWVGVTSALGAGLLTGIGLGVVLTEEKFRKEYRESSESFRRAMEMAGRVPATAPVETEEELGIDPPVKLYSNQKINRTDLEDFKPQTINPYHNAVETADTPLEPFIDGAISDRSVSYIDPEEFEEEDGREKHEVTILMDDKHPVFLMDGAEIRDWDERLGESILLDLVKYDTPFLYVRNHKTDVDYEVSRDMP